MKKLLIAAVAATLVATPAAAQWFGGGDAFANADANQDGMITRAEFAATRAANFGRLDRNGDGAVSKDDLGRLARMRAQAAQRFDQLIKAADTNGDGKVTRQEFAAAPMPMFDRADANGDGQVDRSEAAAAKAMLAQLRDARG